MTKSDTAMFKDTYTIGGYSKTVQTDAERHMVLMNGYKIEHVYKGSVIAELTADVWVELDGDRFRFKGLTGKHSLQINVTNADRLAAHWRVFTEENRTHHDKH